MMQDEMTEEEREILGAFERGEVVSIANVEVEMRAARQAARNTFHKTRRETSG